MKNVVECKREFFAYFNALKTRGVTTMISQVDLRHQKDISKLADL